MSQGALRSSARLAARSAVKIRAALATSISPSRVVAGYLDTHPVASDSRAQDRARARAWAMVNVSLDLEAYKKALARTYVDFYALGLNTAQEQMREASRSKKSLGKAVGIKTNPQTAYDPTFSINWDTWTPGNESAALLLNTPGGLKKLLGDINIQSRSIGDTTHDLLGTALADGIAKGWTPEDIADSLGDFIADPSRALTIAITEGQRAKIEANVQSYADNGVEQVQWTVNAPDDIDCIDNDGQIVNLGDEFNSGDTQPPVHPNCQCDLLPLMPDMTGYGQDSGDSADQADMAVVADLSKYNESQERDSHGRFGAGGGESSKPSTELSRQETIRLSSPSDSLVAKVYKAENTYAATKEIVSKPDLADKPVPPVSDRAELDRLAAEGKTGERWALLSTYSNAYKEYDKAWSKWANSGKAVLIESDLGRQHLDGTKAGVDRYIKAVTGSSWFREKFGDGRVVGGTPKIAVRAVKGYAGQYSANSTNKNEISIATGYTQHESVILHEVAHYATTISATDRYSAHGVEFAKNNLTITEKVIGGDYAAGLKESYLANGVNVG